jgi:recombination protein RecA
VAAKKSSDRADRLAAISRVAARFDAFKPAKAVLTNVKSVPTIFPQIDAATRTGGWPIERVGLIHGPSTEGKTLLALGLGLSFVKKDFFFGLVDAEYTTTDDWIRKEVFREYADHPGFVALRPSSYEATRDAMKQWAETIGEARDKGEIPDDTTGLLVVDSIKKLVPDRMIEKLRKDAEGKTGVGLDGMSGRAAMYKAALNGQLMDEFVPLAYHAKIALVIIGREMENPNAGPWDNPYKLGGGKSIFYDSSIVARVSRSYYKDGDTVAGERHLVRIYKSKVGGKEGKYTDAYFHTSIGTTSQAGFDLARDVLEMSIGGNVVAKKAGKHWMVDSGEVLGDSEAKTLTFLRDNPRVLEDLESKAREAYIPSEHFEHEV